MSKSADIYTALHALAHAELAEGDGAVEYISYGARHRG
jgi:hypothetical protein